MKKVFLLIMLLYSFSLMASASDYLICIDPGHGGSDSGATGIDGGAKPNESDFVLDTGLQLKAQLEAEGFSVIMTRTGDTYPTLTDRTTQANSNGADRFMSIHLNSYSDPAAHGTETLVYSTGSTSGDFGIEVQDAMIATMGFFDRGVKVRTDLSVLKNTTMPAELSEGLFVSNQVEFDYINTTLGITAYATALKDGLCSHLGESCSGAGDTGDTGDTVDTGDSADTVDTGDSGGRVIGFAYDDAYSVTDTAHRISGASVTLADSVAYSENMLTDAAGLFAFQNVPLGEYTLNFTALGYMAQERNVTVTSGDIWSSTGLSADSGDSGDTGDTADTADTADTGNTSGDTANTADTGNTTPVVSDEGCSVVIL